MVKKEKEPQGYRPKIGDKIICEHGGNKYEAKVLEVRKVEPDKKQEQYKVHYQGWNKNWDEWVDEARVSEFSEANLAAMKEQNQNKSKIKGTGSARKKLSSTQQNQANTSIASIKSSSSEIIVVEPEPIEPSKEIKIKIPDELRNWLVDDDNNIKNKKLTVLPAKTVISTILKDFINHRKTTSKSQAEKESILSELTIGIKDYFNVMLGSFLLYKFERLQYQNLLKELGKDPDFTAHYGVIHLVRLATRIGKLLAASQLDSQNMHTIVNYIQDLMRFVSKQPHLFDLDKNYTVAPPDYIKNALK